MLAAAMSPVKFFHRFEAGAYKRAFIGFAPKFQL